MIHQLNILDLSFSRDDQMLFDNLNFTVQSGECLQIYGANGSGKSTLLKTLAGMIDSYDGKIYWDQNKDIRNNRELYYQNINYLSHQNGVKSHLTVFENLKLFSTLFIQQINERDLIKTAHKWNLPLDKKALHLSAGQLRRTALSRLDLVQKILWILDEPLTSLDEDAKQQFYLSLEKHLKNNGMAIIATHHPIELEDVKCDQTIRLG